MGVLIASGVKVSTVIVDWAWRPHPTSRMMLMAITRKIIGTFFIYKFLPSSEIKILRLQRIVCAPLWGTGHLLKRVFPHDDSGTEAGVDSVWEQYKFEAVKSKKCFSIEKNSY
jgi:hypothetical protein